MVRKVNPHDSCCSSFVSAACSKEMFSNSQHLLTFLHFANRASRPFLFFSYSFYRIPYDAWTCFLVVSIAFHGWFVSTCHQLNLYPFGSCSALSSALDKSFASIRNVISFSDTVMFSINRSLSFGVDAFPPWAVWRVSPCSLLSWAYVLQRVALLHPVFPTMDVSFWRMAASEKYNPGRFFRRRLISPKIRS